jgi:alkanesulfonate monooxygenase SsuD/methylene tetrahydromethanopterin reductase-like flavin-dependent oxidoreductase (luciferase family)
MVALVHDESKREEITEIAMKRFPPQGLGKYLAIGTPTELADHFAGLSERGIERFYVWFADFAPPATLERFGEVVRELG